MFYFCPLKIQLIDFFTILSWFVKITLVVGLVFLPQNFGPVVGTTKAFCCSVNVDGVVILLGGGGDTSKLHVVTELV